MSIHQAARGNRCGGLAAIIVALTVTCPGPAAPAQGPPAGDLKPTAFVQPLEPLARVAVVPMPALDYKQLADEDAARERDGLPPRYAVPHPAALTPLRDGTWERVDDGRVVWRLRITAPNAVSINLGFTRYEMPAGGHLFVYAADRSAVLRAFTAADNETHGELWTPPVPSRDVVVEVTVPAKSRKKLDLMLGSVNLGYRTFGQMVERSGSCNVDVVCPEGDGWRDEIPAIAVISTGGSTFCTGFMVNNVRGDLTPYFMTADHCGIGAGNAASLVAFWNYENSWCRVPGSPESGGPGDGTLGEFNTGSFFRAGWGATDFTLVELDDDPDPASFVSYAGWDATGAEASMAIGIHHPRTDEKRISFEYEPTTTTSYLGESIPGNGTHVRVEDWDLGTTEPGSSGSPLFNQDHRIIGQLHGGYASCTSQTSDWYGKLGESWTGGGTSSTRLSDWLDPDSSGVLFTDTISTRGMGIVPAGPFVHLGEEGGPFTDDGVVYTLSNTTPNPVDYVVSLTSFIGVLIDGGTTPLTGTLAPSGGTATVTVTLGPSVYALPAGIFTETIVFDDLSTGLTRTRQHVVEVGQTGFLTTPEADFPSSGPLGGPFTDTMTYTVTSTHPTPVHVTVDPGPPWVEVNGSTSPVTLTLGGIGDSAPVVVGFAAGAGSLPAGIQAATVVFTNDDGGAGDTSRLVSLDVGRLVFDAADVPMPIIDFGTITSTITIPDDFCVGDVDVSLDISHSYIGDLVIELFSPEGVMVRLHSRTGGSADDIVEMYDDDGEGILPDGPVVLTDYDFESCAGVWTLSVADHATGDAGTLNAWSLRVSPAGEVCPPIANDVAVTVPENVPSDITLDATSPTGGTLDYIVTSLPVHGILLDPLGGHIVTVPHVLLGQGDTVTYDPSNGYAGPDAFAYRANDGTDSAEAAVDIEVGGPQLAEVFAFDADPAWTTTGDWAFGPPTGQSGDPASGHTGTNVYGYNLNGDYPSNLPEQPLTSAPIDCSSRSSVEVRFWRWLGVERSQYDHARFQVSNDGAAWTTIWENPDQALDESTWSQHAYDISAVADGQSPVYLRWTMGPTDGSVIYHGWNIDDVEIWAVTGSGCPEDLTGPNPGDPPDGVVNVFDLLLLLGNFGNTPPQDTTGDITGPNPGDPPDGVVNVFDLLELLAVFGQTCPTP